MSLRPAPLRGAIRDLFRAWLDDCRAELDAYARQNGDALDPTLAAAACPTLLGSEAVAAYLMDGNGKEPTPYEDRTIMVRERAIAGG